MQERIESKNQIKQDKYTIPYICNFVYIYLFVYLFFYTFANSLA